MGLTRYGVKTQDLGNQRSWKIGRNSIHWHSVRVFSIATWKIWNRFRIACARISQEESIEEYRQRKLTIEFTLIVGSTHCYQSLHRFLDLLPPNFAIDFFQHGFELRIGSKWFDGSYPPISGKIGDGSLLAFPDQRSKVMPSMMA